MKKAVIEAGAKQYLVSEGEVIEVELLKQSGKTIEFVPLLVLEGDKASVGTPEVKGKVVAEIVAQEVKSDKVTAIRYKAKKRVRKVRGHRQLKTQLKVKTIN